MMKMQKKTFINTISLSVVALVFLVSGLALAQGPGKGMGGKNGKFGCGGSGQGQGWEEKGGPGHMDRMALRLGLDDDQKVAIEKLQDESRTLNQGLRADMMRLRNEMQGEMMKDNPSEKTVLGISAKMTDIKGELQANRLKTKLAVRELLTPEQRDQMLLMGGNGQGRGNGHGQKGGFHGKNGCQGNGGPGCGQGGGPRNNCR